MPRTYNHWTDRDESEVNCVLTRFNEGADADLLAYRPGDPDSYLLSSVAVDVRTNR
jgi:hypothetical protein